jgi:hypothetical protein
MDVTLLPFKMNIKIVKSKSKILYWCHMHIYSVSVNIVISYAMVSPRSAQEGQLKSVNQGVLSVPGIAGYK